MKRLKNVILILLIAVALIGFYWHFSQKSTVPNEIEAEVTELDKLLVINLEKEYPATPRAVVKLYSRITKCFYDYELSDDRLDKLTDMSFALFDEELLMANPKEEYLASLERVIAEYKAADRIISDYTIQDSELIEKYYVDGVEYAKVNVIYSIKDIKEEEDKDTFLSGCGSRNNKTYQYYSTYEEFLLRRDSEGNWKILVWRLPDLSELEED